MIQERSTKRTQRLEAEHLVGRARSCSLFLNERYVSGQHAIIRYTSKQWELRDLGSRNGTFLDGTRIPAAQDHFLKVGSTFSFGKDNQAWTMVDDAAPAPMVRSLTDGEVLEMDGEMIAIPSGSDPCGTIYRDREGTWVLEQSESIAPITNRQVFDVAGRAYRFSCLQDVSKTSLAGISLDVEVCNVELLFCVSRDEEHVELSATCGPRTFNLGTRAHNYLLLTLARRRLADAAEGLPDTTCGWIYLEDLAHDPSMAPPQLNIEIFRIRKQFAAIGILDAADIVERRPRTRQLRIGTPRVSVVPL